MGFVSYRQSDRSSWELLDRSYILDHRRSRDDRDRIDVEVLVKVETEQFGRGTIGDRRIEQITQTLHGVVACDQRECAGFNRCCRLGDYGRAHAVCLNLDLLVRAV